MIGFLYKDLICAGIFRFVGAVIAGFVLSAAMIPFFPEDMAGAVIFLYLVIYMLMIYTLTLGIIVQSVVETDSGVCIEAYMQSLPVGRKKYVAEKYILIFGLFLVLMFFSMLSLFLGNSLFEEVGLIGIGKHIILLLPAITGLFLIVAAAEMPFHFRFGTKAGENVRVAIIVLLFFAGLVYLMFGNLEIFDRFSIEGIGKFFEGHPKFFAGCRIMVPIAAVVFYSLSGALSCLLYPKKKMGE